MQASTKRYSFPPSGKEDRENFFRAVRELRRSSYQGSEREQDFLSFLLGPEKLLFEAEHFLQEVCYYPPDFDYALPTNPSNPLPVNDKFIVFYLHCGESIERFLISPRMTKRIMREKISYRMKLPLSRLFLHLPLGSKKEGGKTTIDLLSLEKDTLATLLHKLRGRGYWITALF